MDPKLPASVPTHEEQEVEVPVSRDATSNRPSQAAPSHSRSRNSNAGVPTVESSLQTPRLTRRKSSKPRSDTSSQDDASDHSNSSKIRRKKSLRRHSSHRPRKSSITFNENDAEEGILGEERTPREEDEGESPSLSDSDREFTLKDRQEAINTTHPFGLPLWKPALYKKSRSVIRNANSALHSTPSPDLYLYPGNILWAIAFGWWLAIVSFIVSIFLLLTPFGGWKYARVLRESSYYIFWPFGKYVERITEDEWIYENNGRYYLDRNDANHGRYEENIGIYQDADGNLESIESTEDNPLLGTRTESGDARRRANLVPKGQGCLASCFGNLKNIGFSGIVFYFWFFLLLVPLYAIVSALCWFMVVSIPMAKLNYVVMRHLRKHPLSLHFKSGSSLSFSTSQRSVILLCTYKAIGWQYYKYTYDANWLHHSGFIVQPTTIFVLSLASVIPLSYFIGMAVASISAQSSAGLGAVINATFEGSIIGSLMAGVLLMPGLSMLSGALKRKEQKFNAKSAGVTSTMLIMAIIGALTPTLFYQIYGKFDVICDPCPPTTKLNNFNIKSSCNRCRYEQPNPIDDPYYASHVRPLMYFCAGILALSYLIGLWFTLRTHASLLWQTSHHHPTFSETADSSINRNASIYKRIIPLHILQNLIPHSSLLSHPTENNINSTPAPHSTGHSNSNRNLRPLSAPGHIGQQSDHSILPDENLHIAQVAVAAATLAAQNQRALRHAHEPEEEEEHGGHDSPNWSKLKSGIVLVVCTLLYSIIAEILVATVDGVLSGYAVDPKFLGLTLFALVPNTTEFMNAMAFAIQGNIALSMEIGSAYALQVCLLQIPAMVLFSAIYTIEKGSKPEPQNTFSLVFPRWDVFAVVFSVFLLTYTYIEGKSNYFKGSILILSYLVLMAGFYWAPPTSTF
ncbi:hypothetical protein G9A89_019740 [Geosiphon pyriformis]|nr:hypothetical protein G9A89_019740 [Geosiphon pyriformis]